VQNSVAEGNTFLFWGSITNAYIAEQSELQTKTKQ
jgi:hypothetical protein